MHLSPHAVEDESDAGLVALLLPSLKSSKCTASVPHQLVDRRTLSTMLGIRMHLCTTMGILLLNRL